MDHLYQARLYLSGPQMGGLGILQVWQCFLLWEVGVALFLGVGPWRETGMIVSITCCALSCICTATFTSLSGWGNEDKQNMAPSIKPYYDTNTALFSSFTLSRHMYAETH